MTLLLRTSNLNNPVVAMSFVARQISTKLCRTTSRSSVASVFFVEPFNLGLYVRLQDINIKDKLGGHSNTVLRSCGSPDPHRIEPRTSHLCGNANLPQPEPHQPYAVPTEACAQRNLNPHLRLLRFPNSPNNRGMRNAHRRGKAKRHGQPQINLFPASL